MSVNRFRKRLFSQDSQFKSATDSFRLLDRVPQPPLFINIPIIQITICQSQTHRKVRIESHGPWISGGWIVQLFYKSIWLAGVILPMLVSGNFPGYGIFSVAIFLTYIVDDILSIPFSYIFAQQTERQIVNEIQSGVF